MKPIRLLLILFALIFSYSCSDDNSTNNKDIKDDDDKNTTEVAIAENNTMISDGVTIELTQIGVFQHTFLDELWFFIDGAGTNTGFNLILKNPLPAENEFRFYMKNNFFGDSKEHYFIEQLRFAVDNISKRWYSVGNAFNIETEGYLYFKRNSNNTISLWTNNLKLGDEKHNPKEHKEFSIKFTFDADMPITANYNPPRFDLISDK
jgi:hypothetical protein